MVLCTRPDQSFTYVTHADRALPKGQQTTWHLRLLTTKQRAWVGARSGKNNWELMDDVCRASIVDVVNLLDPNGQAVAYLEETPTMPVICGDAHARATVIAEALLKTIPPEVRIELMAAALNGAVTLEEDLGN